MGFIRGALVTLFTIILFFSLLMMNFALVISLSLQHDTLQPALKISVSGFLDDFLNSVDSLGENEKTVMDNYCLVESEYAFDYDIYSFAIPCEVIQNGESAIINYAVENFVDQVYYAEYDCEFWQCVKDVG